MVGKMRRKSTKLIKNVSQSQMNTTEDKSVENFRSIDYCRLDEYVGFMEEMRPALGFEGWTEIKYS